ncbi:MAG: type 3 dihydrofolate reductase [Pseudomonadota bacterium]
MSQIHREAAAQPALVSMIAAVADNGVIGANGALPWHLPADLRHFKATTLGKPVVMGRRTFESIGRPLPGRRNLVLSRRREFAADGVERVESIAAALALAGTVDEVVVIGGGRVYAEALPLAQRLYLTQIHAPIDGDTFFPALTATEWVESDRREVAGGDAPFAYSIVTLERRREASPQVASAG